jgi:hypothetical protein
MKAVADSPGKPDSIRLRDVPKPSPRLSGHCTSPAADNIPEPGHIPRRDYFVPV